MCVQSESNAEIRRKRRMKRKRRKKIIKILLLLFLIILAIIFGFVLFLRKGEQERTTLKRPSFSNNSCKKSAVFSVNSTSSMYPIAPTTMKLVIILQYVLQKVWQS